MSYCTCPQVPYEEQKALLQNFIESYTQDNGSILVWSLLSLQEMYQAWPCDVEDFKRSISQTIPFRGGPCVRSLRCCAGCSRQCKYRCIQDCLTRAHMWKKALDNTPEGQEPPLALKMAVASIEAAKDLETISWVVGDMLSQKTNTQLKEYMQHAGLRPEENPYKLDYAPQYEVTISEATGKAHKIVEKETGAFRIRPWPESGLCPYCLPNATHSRKVPRNK